MSFGELQLKKFGWKEGKGLGRDEKGMPNAIKPKLKFNNSGIGFNLADEFTFHWWDHVYNKTANNISVNKTKDGEIKLLKEKEIKVSTKKESKTKKENCYGFFVKGSVLNSKGGCHELDFSKESNDEIVEESLELIKTFTDDELFKHCGGLTGHKGARHGLKMSAKLARLQEQEKSFFATKQSKTDGKVLKSSKLKTQKHDTSPDEVLLCNQISVKSDSSSLNKKKKKKKNKEEDELKVKKSKEENEDEVKDSLINIDSLVSNVRKKLKSKKRKKDHDLLINCDENIDNTEFKSEINDWEQPLMNESEKKRKKSKNKEKLSGDSNDIITDSHEMQTLGTNVGLAESNYLLAKSKKKKKKRKKDDN